MKKRVVFGLPLNPANLLDQLRGQSFCVSYYHRDRLGGQLQQAIDLVADDGILLIDNGAFSAWRNGESLDWDHWARYAEWARSILAWCPQAVAVVPDVIGGTEQQNWELLNEFVGLVDPDRCMPVWHMHESLDYLRHIASTGPYVAIGSSGQYAKVGTAKWHKRISVALRALDRCTVRRGMLRPWVHMMRAQSEMHRYAFDSCDSCNVAVNHNRWRKRHPGDGHVLRMASPIIRRAEASCDGRERAGIDAPAIAAAWGEVYCGFVLCAQPAVGGPFNGYDFRQKESA